MLYAYPCILKHYEDGEYVDIPDVPRFRNQRRCAEEDALSVAGVRWAGTSLRGPGRWSQAALYRCLSRASPRSRWVSFWASAKPLSAR